MYNSDVIFSQSAYVIRETQLVAWEMWIKTWVALFNMISRLHTYKVSLSTNKGKIIFIRDVHFKVAEFNNVVQDTDVLK